MDKIFVIMCLNDIIDDTFYTDEDKVIDRVNHFNKITRTGSYWYKTLLKG
jgi:hypothetical protein